MKNYLKFIFSVYVIIILSSCQKDIGISDEKVNEQNALNKIKNIVGDMGNVYVVNQSVNFDRNRLKTIDVESFKKIMIDLKSKKQIIGIVDSSKQIIKSLKAYGAYSTIINLEEDSIPQNYNLYSCNFNFYNLATITLYFSLDKKNQVVNPSMQLNGISLFGWQTSNMSGINFNPTSTNSSFTFSGSGSFGINIGNQTIGWSTDLMMTFWVNGNNRTCIIADIN